MNLATEIGKLKTKLMELDRRLTKLPTRAYSGGGGGSGSGGGDQYHYERSSVEALPDPATVPRGAFGYITSGDDEGTVYVIGPTIEWEPLNKLA